MTRVSQQNAAEFRGDLSQVRTGIRDELARVVAPESLDRMVDEIFRAGRDRAEDAMQALADDVYAEFKKDISVPVDYSVNPEIRSAVGEFPRYDTGAFSASAQVAVYRPGEETIVAVLRVETPYAGRLNSHAPGGRFYTELTESKWARRAEMRLAISLK